MAIQTQREQGRKVRSLLELGQLIGLDLQIDTLLQQIAQKAAEVMDADRCTIFLYDSQSKELWSTIALGMKGRTIRISDHSGIAGHCFHNKQTINLENAYDDPRFNKSVDAWTGYHTKSLLCQPLYKRGKQALGVIEVLNKKDGLFTQEDEIFLQSFANHAVVFLEMAQLQQAKFEILEQSRQELKRLNQIKDKALEHLSHELRTPLAIIQGKLRVLRRRLEKQTESSLWEPFFAIFETHLSRLLEIQQETDKIMRSHIALEETSFLKDGERFLEALSRHYTIPIEIQEHWLALRQWLKEQNPPQPYELKEIHLLPLILDILKSTKEVRSHRSVTIELEGLADLIIQMDAGILKDLLLGLLKNAVENTPDEGTIRIRGEKRAQDIRLNIEDFGIGITQENQQALFDGLFPTQDPDLYTSKKPYDFYAGGKGLFLLQAKIYGQRFGFDLMMESNRCRHLPRNSDLCPGKISECPSCHSPLDCQAAGGSIFSLLFPNRKG
jgi:signal transduction histidine kinase